MKNILLLIMWAGFSLHAYSQAESGESMIYVKGVVYQNQVRLRWIPQDFGVFKKGNEYGYRVTRQLVSRNGNAVTTAERLGSTTVFGPFKVLSQVDWEAISDTNDIAGVAQGAVYSERFTVSPTGGEFFYEALQQSEENINRYGFGLFAADQSFTIACYLGLGMIDSMASVQEPYGEYTYSVKVLHPDSLQRIAGVGIMNMNNNFSLPSPSELKSQAGVGRVLISLPRKNLEQYYSSFNMERSSDNGITWVKRNKNAMLFLSNDVNSEQMLFNDTIEAPGISFKYRMRGISPFGIVGPPSNIIEVIGKVPVLGIYPDVTKVQEVNSSFSIEWTFPTINNVDITGFQVMRSVSADGGFVLLNTVGPEERGFNDPSPSPIVNYYKVVAIDHGGNFNPSVAKLAQLNDTQAPAVPVGLEATVDPQGMVSLSWTKNIEPDLKGYRVFYANNPSGDFAQITGEVLTTNKFKHQLELKVLAKKVYYRVLATDFRENDSDYSAPLEVNRPDVLPPSKPLLIKADPLPLGVHLEWIRSGSDDVQYHDVQRKRKNETQWESLKKYPVALTDTMYMDSTVRGTGEFAYRVLAVDQSGLAAASTIIEVKPLRTNPDTIVGFKVVSAVEGTQKQARLSWEYPDAGSVQEFHVYRAQGSGTPHLYTTLKVNPEELEIHPITRRAILIYRDKELRTGTTYRYQVLARFPDGNNSPLSRTQEFQ